MKLGRAFPQYQPLPPRCGAGRCPAGGVRAPSTGAPPSPVVRSKIEAQEARRERRAGRRLRPGLHPGEVRVAAVGARVGRAPGRRWRTRTTKRSPTPWPGWSGETAFARVGDGGEQQIDTRGFLARGVRPPRLPRRRPRPAHPPGDLEQGPRPRRPPRRPSPVAVPGRPGAPRRRGRRLRAVQHPLRGRPDPPPRRPVRRTGRLGPRRQAARSARSPASPTR